MQDFDCVLIFNSLVVSTVTVRKVVWQIAVSEFWLNRLAEPNYWWVLLETTGKVDRESPGQRLGNRKDSSIIFSEKSKAVVSDGLLRALRSSSY